ncbi:unnamed protein product [Adineta steineri]|uniref:Uncharacterized protein n=1 Tax=Adineta steineri TaxID=433720 RepID=A0A814MID2_9BILA|nr:unnamed protein product [Adineta steineri]CAF4172534.1 unnamed protein product [Adineta steineri]
MSVARRFHTAIALTNGSVLVTGGYNDVVGLLNSAELYNPSTGTWITTESMNVGRVYQATTALTNGLVLVTGGFGGFRFLNSVEIYNPSNGTWTTTGNMSTARRYHTASILANGKVLVIGGYNRDSQLYSTELYNPSTSTWTTTRSMNVARTHYTTTTLTNGSVLVTGGSSLVTVEVTSTSFLNSVELFNPSTDTWTTIGNMSAARQYHTASILANGKVLVTGGYNTDGALNSAELY